MILSNARFREKIDERWRLTPAVQVIEGLISEAVELRGQLTADEHINRIVVKLRENAMEFELADPARFSHIPDGAGLYLIEVRFPFNTEQELREFGQTWGAAKGANTIENSPRFYSRRVRPNRQRISDGDFIPLYLGKQENIKARLDLHLDDRIESSTYGLKLRERSGLFSGCAFRAAGVVFNIPQEGYFFVELLEAAVRRKLNPIIGKQ